MCNGGDQGGICGIADGRISRSGVDHAAQGRNARFPLALEGRGEGWAQAGIVKDAGDDPDVTHGCLVIATVRAGGQGHHASRRAKGLARSREPGLPIAVG